MTEDNIPLRMEQSLARKLLLPDQLPGWGSSIYDKDPDVPAYFVGEEGERIIVVTKGRVVVAPTFPYKSGPQVLGPIKATKDRIQQEEELVMDLLAAASDYTLPGNVSGALLMSARTAIESRDLLVANLVISPDDMHLYEALGTSFTEDTTYSLVEATGRTMGLEVYAHPSCAQGRAYVLPEARYLGRVCLPPDRDECGIVIFNPRDIVEISSN